MGLEKTRGAPMSSAANNLRVTIGLAALTALVPVLRPLSAQEKTPAEQQALEREVKDKTASGLGLARAGKFSEALETFEKVLANCRTLYPASKFPNGHQDLFMALA